MSSQSLKPRRSSTVLDPYAAPALYYGGDHHLKHHVRARTYSAAVDSHSQSGRNHIIETSKGFPGRRISHGTYHPGPTSTTTLRSAIGC